MAPPAPRRRRIVGQRRRVEDEGDDDGRPEAMDADDESMTDGSIVTDDHAAVHDSDTSNIEEPSPASPAGANPANGSTKPTAKRTSKPKYASSAIDKQITDTEVMLQGMSVADEQSEAAPKADGDGIVLSPPKSPSAPVIVSSSSAMKPPQGARRGKEPDEYRRRRDEDPAFVPNRGAFFMHDQRHGGAAGNNFRQFGGRGRGRGNRGGFPAPFGHMGHMYHPADPTTNSPWTHDMHEAIAHPAPRRPRQMPDDEGPPNGNGFIPTCKESDEPINRMLSTEKHIGNTQVRVFLPNMKEQALFPGMAVKQYTKLPDHRPPLRRDKPVRISLPNRPPRYIFPAADRSFTFIPRAMRPNQQRVRGKPRSAWGSMGGFSRRTSIFGGSYYGSMYSPSVNLSRRSSIVNERDFMFSPTGSVISRGPVPIDNSRPVVRLPPSGRPDMSMGEYGMPYPQPVPAQPTESTHMQTQSMSGSQELNEGQAHNLPMYQPRPQKNISVSDIESPTVSQGGQTYQQAFHQQVPMQVAGGGYQPQPEAHSRRPSHSQHSGTPLSHITERAIHAAPFQPNTYGQPGVYYNQPQPQFQHGQQGYYYPSSAPQGYVATGQPGMGGGYPPQGHHDPASQPPNPNLVAQEANGMVYYYDASSYTQYPPGQSYQAGNMGMSSMMTPNPDGFYYQQSAPSMTYYPQ